MRVLLCLDWGLWFWWVFSVQSVFECSSPEELRGLLATT